MIALHVDYFAQLLEDRGFRLDRKYDYTGSHRYCRVDKAGGEQFISWCGSFTIGGQVILARGAVANRWPFPDARPKPAVFQEARSPFFFIKKDVFCNRVNERGVAEKVACWLDAHGLKWLDEPSLFSDREWAEASVYSGRFRRDYWSSRYRQS